MRAWSLFIAVLLGSALVAGTAVPALATAKYASRITEAQVSVTKYKSLFGTSNYMFNAGGNAQYWTGSTWAYFPVWNSTKTRPYIGYMSVAAKCPSSGQYVGTQAPLLSGTSIFGSKGHFATGASTGRKTSGSAYGIKDAHGHVTKYVRFKVWGKKQDSLASYPYTPAYRYATIPQ